MFQPLDFLQKTEMVKKKKIIEYKKQTNVLTPRSATASLHQSIGPISQTPLEASDATAASSSSRDAGGSCRPTGSAAGAHCAQSQTLVFALSSNDSHVTAAAADYI